jgi:hypothetical protein
MHLHGAYVHGTWCVIMAVFVSTFFSRDDFLFFLMDGAAIAASKSTF